MITKIAFNAEGHVLTKEECIFISNLLKDSYNLADENKKLRKENEALKSKLKTKTYQLDPYRVLIVGDGDVIMVDGASEANKVIIRHL